MPIPAADQFPPDLLQLIELVERSLHHISREIKTRDQAIIVKQRILLPIGGINSRFGLHPTGRHSRNVLTARTSRE